MHKIFFSSNTIQELKDSIKAAERTVKVMRKNYLYAVALVILSLLLWFGSFVYLELRPVEYQNGTFVELPKEFTENETELTA